MKNLLIAVTHHNQDAQTLYKTRRSTASGAAPGWQAKTVVFTQDKGGDPGFVRTREESLGGKRNFAIDYAKANGYDLIAFLDDDDLFGQSWVKGLTAAADGGLAADIYHPQWNVLFNHSRHWLREHIDPSDPRFDSRDMAFYNPWSALCAFNPYAVKWRYREHKKSDPVYSFEDWSFNLDTYCDGLRHVVVPGTFHFLRIRMDSLGKSTVNNTLQHTKYFSDGGDFANRKHATEFMTSEAMLEKYAVDPDLLKDEMKAISKIEPQLYFYNCPRVEQQCNEPASVTVDEMLRYDLCGASDVFLMPDHTRIGGAEKAMQWVKKYLSGFKRGVKNEEPRVVFIDDVPAMAANVNLTQWAQGIQHMLRVWVQTEKRARSIHVCNSGPAWKAVLQNPEFFKGVHVYFYAFNDIPKYSSAELLEETRGKFHPVYMHAHSLDRPNFHIVTDSVHHKMELNQTLGLQGVGVLEVPVSLVPSKRKSTPDDTYDVLWASRATKDKGFDWVLSLLERQEFRNGKIRMHVYGDGDQRAIPFESFDKIPGAYDAFLFTSTSEGMPNVVKEALASGLPVLTLSCAWSLELQVRMREFAKGVPEITELLQLQESPDALVQQLETIAAQPEHYLRRLPAPPADIFSEKSAGEAAIRVFKECLI